MLPFRISGIVSANKGLVLKTLVFFSIVMLFIGLKRGEDSKFMELPTVEIVYAEGDPYSDLDSESEDEALREKEKIVETFLASLREREESLEMREKDLDVKYENLNSIKREIENRLEELKNLKMDIEKVVEKGKAINEANITKLAKVYESTPPEQAGPLLSRMEAKVASQILLRMNNMKAGKMWGFVDPEKAVLISRELAKHNVSISGSSVR